MMTTTLIGSAKNQMSRRAWHCLSYQPPNQLCISHHIAADKSDGLFGRIWLQAEKLTLSHKQVQD